MGGGVTRGLSHEIFMIVDLFGSPEKVYARFSDVKPLDLKSDETSDVHIKFCKKQISFPVSLFLSYAQNKEMRDVKLQFEKGFVYCDFLENIVKVFEKGSNDAQVFDFSDIQRNDVFVSEIKYFFEKITEKHSSINNLDKISIITKLIDELLKFKKNEKIMSNYLKTYYNLDKRPLSNYPELLSEHLIDKFNIKPNSKLLDIGCGRGDLIKKFCKFGVTSARNRFGS